MTSDSSSRLNPGLVWLMSTATGLMVASNYYAQPLLQTIADSLGLSVPAAGAIVTVAQVSYALGLFLLVPLGDLLERRALIAGMTLLAALGLFASAASTSLAMLLAGTAVTGLFSVVAQVLVPFAATLAAPDERGKVVGTLMSGLLLGILLARTFAGIVASAGSWRAMYVLAGVLMAVLAVVLYRRLPRYPAQAKGMSYPRLIGSILALFAQEPVLRVGALVAVFNFASFSMLWTSMAFLLASPPFDYSVFVIGLFGLAGAAGALAAARTGRLADRGLGHLSMRYGLLLMVLGWIPAALVQVSVWFLVVGVLLLDMATQVVHLSCQNAIYKIRPEARSRMTAAYMTSYFIGGSLGSMASAWAYAHGGWYAVAGAGACSAACALLVWQLRRRGPAVSGI
ncbi:Inner membrane transport protein YnfM [Pigmentiphaga humi]|uniref:Inner membrane transport protein YnfM n=1 Tax=Pigmentiphaga humi TaxID=2478468 RepID=A0A3P4AXD4_9BURK|nr:MFS transporter [Pigmentiphaga humi]VCU68432.1 Inner membrane transport protein YnfM [Pigmentiphaga humi]